MPYSNKWGVETIATPSSQKMFTPGWAKTGSLMYNPASALSSQMSSRFEEMKRQTAERQAQEQAQREQQQRQQAIQNQQMQMPIQPGYNQFGQQQQLPMWAQQYNQQFQQPQQQFGQQMPNIGQFGMPMNQQQISNYGMPQYFTGQIPNEQQTPQQFAGQMPNLNPMVAGSMINPENQYNETQRTFGTLSNYAGTNFQAPQFTMGNMGGYLF